MSLLKVKLRYVGDWRKVNFTPKSLGNVGSSDRLESVQPWTYSCGNEGELDPDMMWAS